MNWNAAEEVAEVAAAEYDLCIASDVAYTAVQLLHRPTLSATPSPHTRSSPTLSRSPPHPLQVAYYSPDVAPLAAALRAIGAPTSVIVAPMHR